MNGVHNLSKGNERLQPYMLLQRQAVRGTLAFTIPVLIAFAFTLHANYYFLAAGPLCGIVGGLAYGRRWGLPIILGTCFGMVGILFALQDTRSALFIDVVWVFWGRGGGGGGGGGVGGGGGG